MISNNVARYRSACLDSQGKAALPMNMNPRVSPPSAGRCLTRVEELCGHSAESRETIISVERCARS